MALWHAAFNLAVATTAGTGVPAAVASTLVMAAAVAILVAGLRGRRGWAAIAPRGDRPA